MVSRRASQIAAVAVDHIRVTPAQVRATSAVVLWYLQRYYRTRGDIGLLPMFCDSGMVGSFAIAPEELRRGEPAALFRLLVSVAMFQRRQDAQILRVLQGITPSDAAEITSASRLTRLALNGSCPHLRTLEALHDQCDLTKRAGRGTCRQAPRVACHLKHHTVVLKRYGHFGKMPTSAALAVTVEGDGDLRALYVRAVRGGDPVRAALELEFSLTRIWRVSDKIAAMYLSALTNPDLTPGLAPWTSGVDWTRYVVIDSNVDLFLRSIGYRGPWTYQTRRAFIQALARRLDLRELREDLHPYNPRIVQQAMYLFMSASNRRQSELDCSHIGQEACRVCHGVLRGRCALRRSSRLPPQL